MLHVCLLFKVPIHAGSVSLFLTSRTYFQGNMHCHKGGREITVTRPRHPSSTLLVMLLLHYYCIEATCGARGRT